MTNVGGFTDHAPLPVAQRLPLYELLLESFSQLVDIDEIKNKDFSLSLPLYLKVERSDRTQNNQDGMDYSLEELIFQWEQSSFELKKSITDFFNSIKVIHGGGSEE